MTERSIEYVAATRAKLDQIVEALRVVVYRDPIHFVYPLELEGRCFTMHRKAGVWDVWVVEPHRSYALRDGSVIDMQQFLLHSEKFVARLLADIDVARKSAESGLAASERALARLRSSAT